MPFEPHICDCSFAAYRHVVKSKAESDRHRAMKQNDLLEKSPLDSQILQIPALQRRGVHDAEIDIQPIVPADKTAVPTQRQMRDLHGAPSVPTYKDDFPDHRQKKDLHRALRPTIPESLATATQPKKSILNYEKPIPTYETPIHSRKQKKDIGDVPIHTRTFGIPYPWLICKSSWILSKILIL
jgi:hypothetical protein